MVRTRSGLCTFAQALSPFRNRLRIALAAILAVCCLIWQPVAVEKIHPETNSNDLVLYANILTKVRHAVPYYTAAAGSQRELGYPLKPFLTVRPPLLITSLALMPGEWGPRILLAGLVLLILIRSVQTSQLQQSSLLRLTVFILILMSGLAPVLQPRAWLLHEVWAGVLILIGLLLWKPGRWVPSLIVLTLAAILRELAAPVLLVMAVNALLERRWTELAAWVAAILVFVLTLLVHAQAASAITLASDRQSTGWLALGGLGFVQSAIHWNAVLLLLPAVATAFFLPAALYGLTKTDAEPAGCRLLMTAIGYLAGFMVIGRPDNSYWGLLITPLLGLGLARILCPSTIGGDPASGVRP